MDRDQNNKLFNLAADLVNHTSLNVFLTGKAGTGKTTFLKYIKENTAKKSVVVAPTGVAAINAGGVTMHSFFQLPFGPYVPSGTVNGIEEATDRNSLFRNTRFSAARRTLFQELELVIIDEVSMVRADMLDAIDAILKHFRKKHHLPFGGVQMVFIGDLFQLSPVVSHEEWKILKPFYDSPFFFHAKVTREIQPVYIELKKIYRQNEQLFIDLLNRVRNNVVLQEDLDLLHERYAPAFEPPDEEKFITLTTHNRKADIINESRLNKLPGTACSFEAEISGEFPDKSFPTELRLSLKPGAQVMFIKNDSGEDRKFFNGKLAIVDRIEKDSVSVLFDDGSVLKVEQESWKNIRYNFNQEKGEMEEEELGTFRQFPLRLAWAITIHKSQGLSFDKAIIDAGDAFAPGQVYVALSRCTSLQGMVLHSRISLQAIKTDERILGFARNELDEISLEEMLASERINYQGRLLSEAFDPGKILSSLYGWKKILSSGKLKDLPASITLYDALQQKLFELVKVSQKFEVQLKGLILSGASAPLTDRINRAVQYFGENLVRDILLPLRQQAEEIQHAVGVKNYLKELEKIELVCLGYLEKLNQLKYEHLEFNKISIPQKSIFTKKKKGKPVKGSSKKETLELFRHGKSIDEISLLRNLAISTVEGHLVSLVADGELMIDEWLEAEKLEVIFKSIDQFGPHLGPVKESLGEEFSFAEVRAGISHRKLHRQSHEMPVKN